MIVFDLNTRYSRGSYVSTGIDGSVYAGSWECFECPKIHVHHNQRPWAGVGGLIWHIGYRASPPVRWTGFANRVSAVGVELEAAKSVLVQPETDCPTKAVILDTA